MGNKLGKAARNPFRKRRKGGGAGSAGPTPGSRSASGPDAGSDSDSDSGSDSDGEIETDWLERGPSVAEIEEERISQIKRDRSQARQQSAMERAKWSKFFEQFPRHHQSDLYEALSYRWYADKEVIVQEGDQGDTFYVITEGKAVVSVLDAKSENNVHVITHLYVGDYFGETALIYGSKRTATVAAIGECRCGVLTKSAFDRMTNVRNFLIMKSCDLIQQLSQEEQLEVLAHLRPREFRAGEHLLREGAVPQLDEDALFIVTQGTCTVYDAAMGDLVTLRAGHSVGEMGLVHDRPRNASVRAVSNLVTCLALCKADFQSVCARSATGGFEKKMREIASQLEKVREQRSRKQIKRHHFSTVVDPRTPQQQQATVATQKKQRRKTFKEVGLAVVGAHAFASVVKKAKEASGELMQINDYVFSKQLGQGSFGKVMLATHEQTQKQFAVKVVRRKTQKSLNKFEVNGGEELQREIAAMTRLVHPHIVQLVEVIDDPTFESVYMVQELMEGGELMDLLYPDPDDRVIATPLDANVARGYVRQMITAVHYMHTKGIVHRDLKPQNILLTKDCKTVKICDFGTACFLNDAKSLTVPKGTPAFMAPEILSASTVAKSGPEADVWSLGATLYNLVCGRQPFVANDYLDLVSKVRDDQHVFPRNLDLDPHLRHVITTMLIKDPSRRPSLQDLAGQDEWITMEGTDVLLLDHGPRNA
jgi:CRP-like cAMP-binding protein